MSKSSPSMLTSPDSSMIEDLSADELRWLEASQILDFPSSPTDTFHVNDGVVLSQRKSRFTEDFQRPGGHSKTPRIFTTSSTSPAFLNDADPSKRSALTSRILPSPPRTPPRRNSPSQSSPFQSSPSEWLYRRPKAPKISPVTSALSSTLTLAQPASSQEGSPLLAQMQAGASPKLANAKVELVQHRFEEPATDTKASGDAPFWSNMLRPRSRSARSIPLLKTIPSQSQVDLPVSRPQACDASSISMSRRSPSVSSISSSTLSSAASSSHPDTPVSAHPDPFGAFVRADRGGYHRRHASQPSTPRDYRLGSISSSCPSKSILTRASSISTKDSAGTANKSVKFVEVPTVHYSSAGAWGADADRRIAEPHYSSMDDMGMDVDGMDMHPARSGGGVSAWSLNWTGFSDAQWGTTSELDMDVDPPPRSADDEKSTGNPGPLKRLMSLSRRTSSSSTASAHRRKSSSSTTSSATITPSKPLPAAPRDSASKAMPPPPLPPKTIISGPYVLGSHPATQASSPAHSTISLRSTAGGRHKPKSKSVSATLGSSSNSLYQHGLEDYRSPKNSAARSVRSLASVRSESSTATTSKFKSLMSKVGVGNAWSKN